MSKGRSLLSLAMSFVLACTMMPAAAFGAVGSLQYDADSAESASSAQDSVLVQEDEESYEPEAEPADEVLEIEQRAVASDSASSASLEDIGFVFIEWDAVSKDEPQNIAVGFADEAFMADEAVLKLINAPAGTEHELIATEVVPGAVKFTLDPSSYSEGVYTVSALTIPTDVGDIVYDFTEDDSSEYSFVITDTEEEPTEGTSVYTFDDSGDLVEQDSIAGALDEAGAQSAGMMARSLSARANGLVVVLDPGHGGSDGGTSHNGLIEKNINLKIAQYCRNELQRYNGVTVHMTRNSDVAVGLEERANLAKRVGADVFVSIHNNASGNPSANGSEVIVPLNGSGTELGYKILDQLASLGLTKRSVYDKSYESDPTIDYYSVIRNTASAGIPGIIVEHAFVSNPSDAAFLDNEANLQRLGIADATGIAQRYGLSSLNRQKATEFVTRLYEKVLGRTPDAGGLNDHVDALMRGASASDIAWGFFSSPEFSNKRLSNAQRVEIAYSAMLDRAADASGKADWTGKLDIGMSMRAVISGFSNAPEFRNLCSRWGLNPGTLYVVENRDRNQNATAFVQRLYQKVMNRTGDVNGLNTHTGSLLSGASAANLAWSFFSSAEFNSKNLSNEGKVQLAYQAMFDRGLDSVGKRDWVGKLDVGMSMRAVISGMCNSNEYRALCAKWGIAPGSLSVVENRDRNQNATAFVQRLYQKVMNRTGDVNGLNTHAGSLLSGASAANLAWSFFSAPEFSKRGLSNSQIVEIAYQTMLNRPSEAAGKASWVEKMDHGMPLRLLIAGFSGSNEFQALCRSYGLTAGSLPYNPTDVERYSWYKIMGSSSSSVIQNMVNYFNWNGYEYPSTDRYKSSDARDIQTFCRLVYEEASAEGVKPEVVFCQAMKETGWLQYGGSVHVDQFNYAGLGAVDASTGGATFSSVREGIRAQVQHLKCYASTASLKNPLVDPRWYAAIDKHGRGCAPTLEELNGKWAVPGYGYGQSIRSMIEKMLTL